MKKVLALALFAAASVGASAQYSIGDTDPAGLGNHLAGGNNTVVYSANTSGASAAATVMTEVVQNASVHYLNKPITVTSAMNVGVGQIPTSQADFISPTFFLIQGQSATFEHFIFEIRGSERSTVDIAWSVTGNNGNVDLTAADAGVNGGAEAAGTADVSTNMFSGTVNNQTFMTAFSDPDAQVGGGTTDGTKNNNQYDATGAIHVDIDFTAQAINEPTDDGFPGGAGDPTDTGTSFEVKVAISDYQLIGSTNIVL